jgi:hypothetical protein
VEKHIQDNGLRFFVKWVSPKLAHLSKMKQNASASKRPSLGPTWPVPEIVLF